MFVLGLLFAISDEQASEIVSSAFRAYVQYWRQYVREKKPPRHKPDVYDLTAAEIALFKHEFYRAAFAATDSTDALNLFLRRHYLHYNELQEYEGNFESLPTPVQLDDQAGSDICNLWSATEWAGQAETCHLFAELLGPKFVFLVLQVGLYCYSKYDDNNRTTQYHDGDAIEAEDIFKYWTTKEKFSAPSCESLDYAYTTMGENAIYLRAVYEGSVHFSYAHYEPPPPSTGEISVIFDYPVVKKDNSVATNRSTLCLPQHVTVQTALAHFLATSGSGSNLLRASGWFLYEEEEDEKNTTDKTIKNTITIENTTYINKGVSCKFNSEKILSRSCVLQVVCVVADSVAVKGEKGLFFRGRLREDQFICEYKGIVRSSECKEYKENHTSYVWLAYTQDRLLDPSEHESPGKYANYISYSVNAKISKPSRDYDELGQLVTISLRSNTFPNQSGDEVSASYGKNVLENQLELQLK